MQNFINEKYEGSFKKLKDSIVSLRDISNKLEVVEYNNIYEELIENLSSPFMFVIVGEVKAGKSSFINALLNTKDLTKTDADICTVKVEKIVYSQEEYVKNIKENLVEKGINNDMLKNICIVDTPGTDSIVKEHEVITKNFTPYSDLIIFVFPILNPHHGSSWQLLDYMKSEWNKNIIFVAQQKDRATDYERDVNTKKISDYAIEHGVENPKIFQTSAKLELEGNTSESGFQDIRKYIEDTVTGDKHIVLKLDNNIATTNNLITKVKEIINIRKENLARDIEMRTNINKKFTLGKQRSSTEIDNIISRLLESYDNTTNLYIEKLKSSLTAGKILKQAIPFVKKEKIDKRFFENFITEMRLDLAKNMENEVKDNSKHFINGIEEIFNSIMEEMDKNIDIKSMKLKSLETFYKKREEIYDDIRGRLHQLSNEEEYISLIETKNADIGNLALQGGALAAIGVVLAVIAEGAIFDITGGILTTIGVLGTGSVVLFKRDKVIKDFKNSIKEARDKFKVDLKNRLNSKLDILFEEINRSFVKLDNHISIESDIINSTEASLNNETQKLEEIKKEYS